MIFLKADRQILLTGYGLAVQNLKEQVRLFNEKKIKAKDLYAKLKKSFSGLNYWQRWQLLCRLETALRLRPLKVGIFDHTMQLIGGGQKYGLLIAQALKENYQVSLLVNKKITLSELGQWYQLDLSGIELQVIPIPFYEERKMNVIDPAHALSQAVNPFKPISAASMNFDLFINNSMLEMVLPLSPLSAMIVHFPERGQHRFFYGDYYRHIICNSQYTARWISRRWKLNPEKIISPPIIIPDMPDFHQKEKIILSVARFEPGGTKKQLEMIEAFDEFLKLPSSAGWKMILAGGSIADNPYLQKVFNRAEKIPEERIKILSNISAQEISELFQKASVFWHLCGFKETNPANIEHFGMSTLEGMAQGVVPIVFNGGGQREVVQEGQNGFLCNNLEELVQKTELLITNRQLYARLQKQARQTAEKFSLKNFRQNIRNFFDPLLKEYLFQNESAD